MSNTGFRKTPTNQLEICNDCTNEILKEIFKKFLTLALFYFPKPTKHSSFESLLTGFFKWKLISKCRN